jgi:hypothetical protein
MINRIRQWFDPEDVRWVGTTPDYRFSLANERTFLAWPGRPRAGDRSRIAGLGAPCEAMTACSRSGRGWRGDVPLAAAPVAILAARLALARGTAGAPLGAVALLGALALGAVAYRRGQAIGGARPGPPGSPLVLSALAAVGYAVLAILLVLASLV